MLRSSDSSDLPGPSAASVWGNAGDGSGWRGAVSPTSERDSARSLGSAGPAKGQNDHSAGRADRQGPLGGPNGALALGPLHSRRQPTPGQTPAALPKGSLPLFGSR